MEASTAITVQLQAALWECCPPNYIRWIDHTPLLHDTALELSADVDAFASKDPASGGDPLNIIQAYTSFKAILHYRLAHKLERHFSENEIQYRDLPLYASLISSRGKLLSGAELHHRCRIGKRFILDHGIGTVFGETAQIGDDCYILGGVTLGSCGISNNPHGKRHPTIGNRVQIGAFSRVIGAITIGDDVIVGPHCTITKDILPRSKVTLRANIQVVNLQNLPPAEGALAYGAVSHEA